MLFGEFRDELNAKEASIKQQLEAFLMSTPSDELTETNIEDKVGQIITDHFQWLRNDVKYLEQDVLASINKNKA